MTAVAVPPAIPTVTAGGRVFTDLTNLKRLITSINGAASPSGTFRAQDATPYQVPAGKTFRVVAIICYMTTSGDMAIGYADNNVGVSSGTPYTNFVQQGGTSSTLVKHVSSSPMYQEFGADFIVPAQKYPCMSAYGSGLAGSFEILGYEV